MRRVYFRTLLAALSLSLGACQGITCQGITCPGISSAAPGAERLQGVWRVTALANEAISSASRAYIEFSEPPRLTGNAGCNRFFGIYEYQGGALSVDDALGASKMLCPPSVMAVENQLLSFLPQSRQVQLEEGRLELRDSRGRLLIAAQRELNP